MGPNLTGLFAESREVSGYFTPAQELKTLLFDLYGEALIEALEKLVLTWETYADRPGSYPAFVKAKQLLAQLEREAQP